MCWSNMLRFKHCSLKILSPSHVLADVEQFTAFFFTSSSSSSCLQAKPIMNLNHRTCKNTNNTTSNCVIWIIETSSLRLTHSRHNWIWNRCMWSVVAAKVTSIKFIPRRWRSFLFNVPLFQSPVKKAKWGYKLLQGDASLTHSIISLEWKFNSW